MYDTDLIARLRLALQREGHAAVCAVTSFGAAECTCKTYATFDRVIARQSLTMGVVERLTSRLHATRMLHSCMTCMHFKESTEICGMYEERPPARVIAFGCPSWTDDSAMIADALNRSPATSFPAY